MKAAEAKKSQIDKFREAARELETDDSEEAFDRALKRIAVTPPKPEDEKSKKERPLTATLGDQNPGSL